MLTTRYHFTKMTLAEPDMNLKQKDRPDHHRRASLMERPQLTVDLAKVQRNIFRVVDRLRQKGVFVRPHFKTHQCAAIGELFRDAGITAATVSSLDMAAYFAGHGWRDLTLAVPVNHGQLHAIRDFDPQVRLNLLVDSAETIIELHDALSGIGDIRMKRSVWIKVDVGYGRVGIQWSKEQELLDLVRLIGESDRLEFGGLLTHSGHTYDCRGREEVIARFEEGRARMLGLQRMLGDNGITAPISMGDTPSASLAENFDGVDEMRPGNFVFYDLVQSQVGSCRTDDIAVATACPVIGKYEDDLKVVVYGGAVHLSKDSIMIDGERIFGQLALPAENGWEVVPLSEGKMVSCCQEVSKLKVSPKVFERIELGKTVYILPAHSCLAAEMHPRYLTTNGKVLERFRLYT
ncbi:MAG: hypothetical protein RL346_2086 [Verrucomicrobiota bacterium]